MPISPYHIRQATKFDLPEIAYLETEAFAPYGTAECPDTLRARLAVFPEGFAVLQIDDLIAGYGTSEKWTEPREPELDEDPNKTHDPNGQIFSITGLAVRLAYRGRGFGLAILDHLIALARRQDCTQIILQTTHAQGLYLKRGFNVVGNRLQFGVTLSIMKLDLPSS
jgi:ribosomal protein S18 acetylase RimI-like enzyme